MTSTGQPAVSHPPAPAAPETITRPRHPVAALTTYELRDYRRDLERAIQGITPDAPARADLRRKLDAVLVEQEDRARLAMRDPT